MQNIKFGITYGNASILSGVLAADAKELQEMHGIHINYNDKVAGANLDIYTDGCKKSFAVDVEKVEKFKQNFYPCYEHHTIYHFLSDVSVQSDGSVDYENVDFNKIVVTGLMGMDSPTLADIVTGLILLHRTFGLNFADKQIERSKAKKYSSTPEKAVA